MKELSTNCTFIQPISKYQFYVKGDNCTFTYPYRCQFLHYSQYPQNPDRGLVLGAVIVESENNLWYGNTENLRIPTPDFSMVYNTPVISGIVFSLTFAYILRMRFQTKTEKKKDKEEEKQD
ncbi:GPI transamidase component GPI16 [Histomonas meleagridis]|uniref:GPI transamidase component GPI16 n=1 Tax=Histomonas meleagridis TaxID=135588 RepID=UPI00355A6B5F|nr:GPI transamidase component GPI16 [Histomonas meleagridis]KAH0805977.1 GPI transamidase component GPI16 [Histomonas meleagridis]